jgi:uncharacterized protein YoxC
MLIEICLAIITLTLIILVISLIRLSTQAQRSIQHIRMDVHNLSAEVTHLVNSMNEFVRTDLHDVSKETSHLITKLNDLSSDINNKSHSLNFLFKPLQFLSSKLSSGSPSSEPNSKRETVPQLIKWIVSSIFLYKSTKEIIKKYEK